jgi:hypothetical protein
MKKLEKILAENMRRFGTKNLSENIKLDPNFIEEVTVILNGALDDDLMTDNIVDELGDFYDDVYDSGDSKLISLYDNLRNSQDTDCIQIAKSAKKLLDYLAKSKNINEVDTYVVASSQGPFNATEIEIYEHILNAIEVCIPNVPAIAIDDFTDTHDKRYYITEFKKIIDAIEKLANTIDEEMHSN